LSCEAADVAYIFKIGREDHDREWAGHLILAEVHEMHAFGADFHAQNFSRHAFGFSDVLAGLANGEAVGCGE
jgi:hypothetical protein